MRPHFATITPGDLRRYRFQVAAIAAWTALFSLFALSCFFYWIVPVLQLKHESGTMLTGTARVEAVTYLQGTEANPTPEPIFRVGFEGRSYEVQGSTDARIGDKVRIRYRVGKNGDIYMGSIGEAVGTH